MNPINTKPRHRNYLCIVPAALAIVGVLSLQAQTPNPLGGAGTRSVAVLLCQYADKPNTYGYTPASILPAWVGGTATVNNATVDNSINGLVRDASLGTVDFNGTQAFGWYTLPGALATYPSGSDAGDACIVAAQQNGVNLSPFTYVAVYMNDVLNDASGISWTGKWNNQKPSPTSWNRSHSIAKREFAANVPDYLNRNGKCSF